MNKANTINGVYYERDSHQQSSEKSYKRNVIYTQKILITVYLFKNLIKPNDVF